MVTISSDIKLDFNDVLIVPRESTLSSRSEVNLINTYSFVNSGKTYTGIGIVASNMDGVGTPSIARKLEEHNMFTSLVKHYPVDLLVSHFKNSTYSMYSMGISYDDLDKFERVYSQVEIPFVTIDVANGYSQTFSDFICRFRTKYPNVTIIAGNVVTPERCVKLLSSGADIVKVGIGPSSACSTRIKTGIGYPQLSAVIECSQAVKEYGGHLMSDGGVTCPGDVAKAFAAGADFVMIGSYFAGTDESEEHLHTDEHGNKYIVFYGMSSKTAQEKHGAGLADYRASEGRVLKVPYKGSITPIVSDLLGSLRSTCTYVGAKNLSQLSEFAKFVRVNRQIATLYGIGELMQ